MRAQRRRLPRLGLQVTADEEQRMVGEVRADTGQIGLHRDAMLTQMRGGADAVPHQERRRMDAAQAGDDLLAAELPRLAADLRGDAGRLTAVERNPNRSRTG